VSRRRVLPDGCDGGDGLVVVVLGSGKWCPTRSNATTG